MNTTSAAVSAAITPSIDPSTLHPAVAVGILGAVVVIIAGMALITKYKDKKNDKGTETSDEG